MKNKQLTEYIRGVYIFWSNDSYIGSELRQNIEDSLQTDMITVM